MPPWNLLRLSSRLSRHTVGVAYMLAPGGERTVLEVGETSLDPALKILVGSCSAQLLK